MDSKTAAANIRSAAWWPPKSGRWIYIYVYIYVYIYMYIYMYMYIYIEGLEARAADPLVVTWAHTPGGMQLDDCVVDEQQV